MTRIIAPCTMETLELADLPRPGDLVAGKYRIEREIGRGGMGVVYEVTHVVMTQSRFAIKWLVTPGGGDSEAIRRFRREARVSGAIRHPNVVEVYDVHLDESGSYMVMALLEGESLAQRIARQGALPYWEACRIVRAALSGIIAAHAQGVVHRDLKPANIFLCRTTDGTPDLPKVVDFGISRVISAAAAGDTTETRRGTRIGTPVYMAPEQMRAEECDQRTDVYALGVTLYEVISGRRAYLADTEAELVYKILAGAATPLDQVVRGLPAGLSAVVMRAMAVAPSDRFESAQQLSAALAPYEKQVAPAAPRRPRWPWVAAAAIGCGAAALGVFLWLREPAPQQETVSAPATLQPAAPPASVPTIETTGTAPGPQPTAAKPEPAELEPSAPLPTGTSAPAVPPRAKTAARPRAKPLERRTPVQAVPAVAPAAPQPAAPEPSPAIHPEPAPAAREDKPVVRIDSF